MRVWRHTEVGCAAYHTLVSQQREDISECPRGARMALKDYVVIARRYDVGDEIWYAQNE